MGRPRVLKLAEGEVILKNVPKEESDRIIALLSSANTSEEEQLEEVVEVDESLNETAIGVAKNITGHWHLVEVKYNLSSKKAAVASSKDLGQDKAIVLGDFRVLAAKKFMV